MQILGFFLSLLLGSAVLADAPKALSVSSKVLETKNIPFISRGDALAMNIEYTSIQNLRKELEKELGTRLKYFTGWSSVGEAHVTVITPPELKILKTSLPLKKIEEIAQENKIQESDLKVIGLGTGQIQSGPVADSTFFIIVESKKLLKIREKIHAEFEKAGGKTEDWDPKKFFPHITVAYTKRDLHESDGVIKDADHSLDPRFSLSVDYPRKKQE